MIVVSSLGAKGLFTPMTITIKIVLKIILNIKEYPHHNYKDIAQRNNIVGITFRMIFCS
jgi:hypothetical protein